MKKGNQKYQFLEPTSVYMFWTENNEPKLAMARYGIGEVIEIVSRDDCHPMMDPLSDWLQHGYVAYMADGVRLTFMDQSPRVRLFETGEIHETSTIRQP
jgi:hypothetical protein